MKNIILGTDWWTDCDDCVALRLLTNAHKSGDIRLLGVVINACAEQSVASLDAFLHLDGCGGIPIGIDTEATDFCGTLRYQPRLAEKATRYLSNDSAEGGVALYRRLLAEAREPVEMIEIGFLNTFASLLASAPDDISELDGASLVKEKVSKMWVMAGKWDKDGESEHNFEYTPRSIAGGADFLEKCPVPVTFLGWEVGFGVITGGEILDTGDHLYMAMADHGSSKGRHSWDPMTVLMALIGDEAAAGYRTVRGRASLSRTDGTNYFSKEESGPHAFVVKTMPDDYYKDLINSRIALL